MKSTANQAELARLTGQLTKDNQESLARMTAELDRKNKEDLARLNYELDERKEELTARREYEKEARKRLYQECEPLIFQFVELSENALHRIYSLARSARRGNLPDWLENSEYYIASTMYHLLAPVVVYKLIQRRLTIVDLTLDRNIDIHYQLVKLLAWSFTDDFDFAWGLKVSPLSYDPNNPNWQQLRLQDPSTYWRQGLPIGRFDNAVEALIIRDPEPNNLLRIMSFGEFETALHKPGTKVQETFAFVHEIIAGFHPQTRPVLWRMLIAQAHIYDAIVGFHKQNADNKSLTISPIPEINRETFYWKKNPNDQERQQLEEPFIVAEAYLQQRLEKVFRSQKQMNTT